VKEGATVLYGKYAGTEIDVDGEKLLIMRQNDILAICE
ncbi:MAG: co-chaperone GroES, partial [Muribaculaceae bacterium]|nr:co-chaperone GroES [Muribaculaceae bacterium]